MQDISDGAPIAEPVSGDGAPCNGKVRLAVFDFDGTCISGNSPELLVRWLAKRRMLSLSTIGHLISWGLHYKFKLAQDESSARGYVFTAFHGVSKNKADASLLEFYDRIIASKVRRKAIAQVTACKQSGQVPIMVSATFETIAMRALKDIPFDFQISTRMKLDEYGRYTTTVEGLPVEGEEKVTALTRWANARYGEGNWVVNDAFGDHYSDIAILSFACHPHAVTPDTTLKKHAQSHGWPVLNWAE